jgi:hypothetical protein
MTTTSEEREAFEAWYATQNVHAVAEGSAWIGWQARSRTAAREEPVAWRAYRNGALRPNNPGPDFAHLWEPLYTHPAAGVREALRELTDAIDAFLSDNGEEEPTAGVAERLYAAHKAARAALAQQDADK